MAGVVGVSVVVDGVAAVGDVVGAGAAVAGAVAAGTADGDPGDGAGLAGVVGDPVAVEAGVVAGAVDFPGAGSRGFSSAAAEVASGRDFCCGAEGGASAPHEDAAPELRTSTVPMAAAAAPRRIPPWIPAEDSAGLDLL